MHLSDWHHMSLSNRFSHHISILPLSSNALIISLFQMLSFEPLLSEAYRQSLLEVLLQYSHTSRLKYDSHHILIWAYH